MATGAPEASAIRKTIGERTLRHHLGDLAAHFGRREVAEIVVNRPGAFGTRDAAQHQSGRLRRAEQPAASRCRRFRASPILRSLTQRQFPISVLRL
jgi:hypothetical protein